MANFLIVIVGDTRFGGVGGKSDDSALMAMLSLHSRMTSPANNEIVNKNL